MGYTAWLTTSDLPSQLAALRNFSQALTSEIWRSTLNAGGNRTEVLRLASSSWLTPDDRPEVGFFHVLALCPIMYWLNCCWVLLLYLISSPKYPVCLKQVLCKMECASSIMTVEKTLEVSHSHSHRKVV